MAGWPVERDLTTETPTDAENPTMYVNGTYILGGIVGLALVGLVALALVLREQLPTEIVTAFVALASPAVAGLAGIYNRKG